MTARANYRKNLKDQHSFNLSAKAVFKAILLIAFAIYLLISFISYNFLDPSFLTYTNHSLQTMEE